MKTTVILIIAILLIPMSITTLEGEENIDFERLQQIEKAGIRLQDFANGNDTYRSEGTYDDEMIPVYLVMSEQLDTDQLYRQVINFNRQERRAYTVEKLKSFSDKTQKELRTIIEGLKNAGDVRNVRYLWITNVIGMYATVEAISIFSENPDVALIEYDPLQYVLMDDFEGSGSSQRGREDGRSQPGGKYRNPSENVAHHNAPAVWEDGITGEGVVVSVIDTGVNYNHHDIRERMWEHQDFPYHGWNTFANNNQTMDDHSHGTHCAGTVAGDGTSGIDTGIAPGAQIMALKCIGSSGSGQEQMYWQAVEFSVEHGADVISVSLGWRYSGNPNRSEFRRVMANCLNAGVVASIAAGNESTSGLRTPGDCPPPWLHPDQETEGGLTATVTVGATDTDDNIANFSSRGPVGWNTVEPYFDYPLNPGSGLIKPDICAVGVQVNSLAHNNITGYRRMSGTSMATPAVAGVMALLLDKNPNLLPEDVGRIIEETAIPMSETKSNTFGSGIINIIEAVDEASTISVHEIHYLSEDGVLPQYGDLVTIGLSLINGGLEEAEEISVTLSSDDEYVEILDDFVVFPEIEMDSVVTIDDAFQIEIADNIPDRYELEFLLDIVMTEEDRWQESFSIQVRAPDMSTGIPHVIDAEPDGNNNGIIDPGEEFLLYIPIRNSGSADSPEMELTIECDDEDLQIIELSQTNYTPVISSQTVYSQIRMAVSEEVERGDRFVLNYQLQAGNYTFEGVVTLVIGGLLTARLGEGNDFHEDNDPGPINIYFRSFRGQIIYTAEELNEQGIFGPIPITDMGFYIYESPDFDLPNYRVKMKHTEAENAAEHDDGPFHTVSETEMYSPEVRTWDKFGFQDYFLWNGVDNVLIDVSFEPVPEWRYSGIVRIYDAENGMRFARDDESRVDVETDSVRDYKPQLDLTFNTVLSNELTRPVNLSAVLQGLDVVLEWELPETRNNNASNDKRTTRNVSSERESGTQLRNPDGYNIYRNGILMNEEPVEDREFIDDDYDPAVTYYYYVTAVYENEESVPSNVSKVVFRTAKPLILPENEIQYDGFQVIIENDTPDAEVYYTLDGSEPDKESFLYENPFNIDEDTIVKAAAYREGWLKSDVAEKDFKILYSPVSLEAAGKINSVFLEWSSPLPERIVDGHSLSRERRLDTTRRFAQQENRSTQSRSLRSSNEKAELRTAGPESRNMLGYNVYRKVAPDSFLIVNEETVKEEYYTDYAIPAGGQLTYYVTAVYEAGESMPSNQANARSIVSQPEFEPEPGEYEEPFDLRISSTTEDAVIHYTVDGSDPDQDSKVYSDEDKITINATTTVKAVAFLDGWEQSEIAKGEFSLPTGVDDQTGPAIETALKRAYPNPFNPETVIEFAVADVSDVTIDVFDITGRRIISLIGNEQIEPGYHRVVWKGVDKQGRRMSSGVYFYRMVTDEYEKIRKVLMLK